MMIPKELLRDKFRGAILCCFLGDAFGAGFEGISPDKARSHLSSLPETVPRTYTDDTDMTLALTESIVDSGRVDPEDIADKFSQRCDLTWLRNRDNQSCPSAQGRGRVAPGLQSCF